MVHFAIGDLSIAVYISRKAAFVVPYPPSNAHNRAKLAKNWVRDMHEAPVLTLISDNPCGADGV